VTGSNETGIKPSTASESGAKAPANRFARGADLHLASDGVGVATRCRAWFAELGASSRPEMALLMTLAMLLLNPVLAPVELNRLLVMAALLYRPLRHAALFWFVMGAFRLFYNMPDHWYSIDNHQYLITWWCLGVGASLLTSDKPAALATTGRRLIGLCFGFAALWKVLASDFLSGRFMHWVLVTDSRFAQVSEGVGLPAGATAENVRSILDLQQSDLSTAAPVEIVTSDLFQTLGVTIGWWTLAIEAAVALLFLLPERYRATRWRNWALFVFIATTYPIAPVIAFAWLLLAMSVAATPKENRTWLPVAFLAFVLVNLAEYTGGLFSFIGGAG
jgi:hypothetical protein